MLGALEVKIVARLARQHAPEWKALHTAVMYYLLAHRRLSADRCWPEQSTIAASCNVTVRTVGRVVARFRDWGLLHSGQIRAVASGKVGPAQYVFHFNLPQSVEEKGGPSDKKCLTVRQNRTRNKEEARRSKAKRTGAEERRPPQNYTQQDFDERDWRKLQREIDLMREAGVGSAEAADAESHQVALFRIACERAGISTRRGKELYRRMLA
jgi:hypothetical protein